MLIDQTTLSDLEILQSPDGAPGVLQLLDRTVTPAGGAALRRRLQQPSDDVSEIRGIQEAVTFLRVYTDVLRQNAQALEVVIGYLESNVAVVEDPTFGYRAEQLWMTVRYRDVVRELREGVRATTRFFERMGSACDALLELGPPTVLSSVAGRVSSAARDVRRADAEAVNVLDLDRKLRTTSLGAIRDALGGLAELDALRSMALATDAHGWVMPELMDAEGFHLEADGLVHPFVSTPIANPVRLTGGEPMVFLTGPNMAGKTTYLRSIALLVLLAQVGMGVPASRARLTPVKALLTSLNPRDNLRAGLSYFLAEVLRVKSAAEILAEGHRALVMFDEVFKGTNVKDALEASAEVILGFAKARGSGFVFSSHLVELADVLSPNPAIRFCYFDGDIVEGTPRYSYRLQDGISDKRFGLHLLREARVSELIERIGA